MASRLQKLGNTIEVTVKALITSCLLVLSFSALAEVERFEFEANCQQQVSGQSRANRNARNVDFPARLKVRVQHGTARGLGRLSVTLKPDLSFIEERNPWRAHIHTFRGEFATDARNASSLLLVRPRNGDPTLRLAYDHHVMDDNFEPVASRSTFTLARRQITFHNPNSYVPLRRSQAPTLHGVRTSCTLQGNLDVFNIQSSLASR